MTSSSLARLSILLLALALVAPAAADGLRLADPPPPSEPAPAAAPAADAEDAPPLRFGEPTRRPLREKRDARPASGDDDFTVSCFGPGGSDVTGFETGIRAGSFIASDDWVTSEGGALYGGVGFTFRWRALDIISVDFGFDVLGRGSESGDISETRINGNVGVNYFFVPSGLLHLYVSGGLAFNDTTLDFEGPVPFNGSYQEYGAYSGLGFQVVLDDWRIDSEFRAVTLARDDDFIYPDNSPYSRVAPDFRVAAQWFLGVSYRLF